MKITYFVHGTTSDNEKHKTSGWNDVELSEIGKQESAKLKELTKSKKFDVVFCSDLKRAVETAKISFSNVKIISDKDLREINYGDLTQADSQKVNKEMAKRIEIPFPNGESYKDVEKRVRKFLEKNKNYNHIAIVAHRAPQLALEVILRKKNWETAIKEDWRLKNPKEWKPGWEFEV